MKTQQPKVHALVIGKKVIFKNFAPFTDSISVINNKEIVYAKDIDVVMPRYKLIEYSDNYWKTSGSLWHYYRDEPFIDNNDNIIDAPDDTNSAHSIINKKYQVRQEIIEQKMFK